MKRTVFNTLEETVYVQPYILNLSLSRSLSLSLAVSRSLSLSLALLGAAWLTETPGLSHLSSSHPSRIGTSGEPGGGKRRTPHTGSASNFGLQALPWKQKSKFAAAVKKEKKKNTKSKTKLNLSRVCRDQCLRARPVVCVILLFLDCPVQYRWQCDHVPGISGTSTLCVHTAIINSHRDSRQVAGTTDRGDKTTGVPLLVLINEQLCDSSQPAMTAA